MLRTSTPRILAGVATTAVALSLCTLTAAGATSAPAVSDDQTTITQTGAAVGTPSSLAPVRGLHTAIEPVSDDPVTVKAGGQVVFDLPSKINLATKPTATLVTYETAVPAQTALPPSSVATNNSAHTVTVTLPSSPSSATGAYLQLSGLVTTTAWNPLAVSPVTGTSVDIAASAASSDTQAMGLTAYLDAAGIAVTPGVPFSLTLPASNAAVAALGNLTFLGGKVGFGPFSGDDDTRLQKTTGDLDPKATPDGRTVTLTLPADYPTYGYPSDAEDPKLVLLPSSSDPDLRDVSFYVFDIELRNSQLPASGWPRYVTRIYNDLFGRSPDTGGLNSWSATLASGANQAAVSNAITGSREYRTGMVRGAYQTYLGRDADGSGLSNWLGAMDAGTPIQSIECYFVASTEYYQNARAAWPSAASANAAWVQQLYADVLGRTASAGEVAGWAQQLNSGQANTVQIAFSFLYSTEHLNTVVAGYYEDLLHRGTDAGGQAYWVNQLQHGARVEQIIAQIVTSQEYMNRI